MSQMSKDITPSVQVLGLSQAVPSKDMSRPNINTAFNVTVSFFGEVVLFGVFSLPSGFFSFGFS